VTTVVVDGLSVGLGGGLTYTGSQLAALTQVRPDLDLTVLVSPANHEALAQRVGSAATFTPVEVGGSGRRVLWEQLRLASQVPDGGLLHCPGNLVPLRSGASPVVLVVQNPNAFGSGRHERWNRSPRRRARIALMRASVAKADRVVAVSQSMADLVVEDRPDLADRVVVVQDGAPVWPEPAAPLEIGLQPGSYLLSVAQDWPHKLLDRLVAVWSAAFAGRADAPALVMAGHVSDVVRARRAGLVEPGLRDRLVQLGAVADRAHLRWLLEHAVASVSFSALEAHPHGPAEAGALGCPLVLSDIAPHHEVTAPAGPQQVAFVALDDVEAQVEALRSPPSDRTPWTWPVTWEDNARQVAAVFDELRP
jgi:glycosyltransferase involved in cell wall biosynthesis